MCGIAGIVDFSGGRTEERRERVRAMTDILSHRGPDSAGYFNDGCASLGHRRLAIIDLSSGDQPMTTEDGRFTIVFNGELYNFQSVRDLLRQKGRVFRTRSDTEVVLQAYAEWGEQCVDRFNGMFALAIWDATERRLFLARDRVGKKPLYYVRAGDKVVFASELKSVLASGLAEARVDRQSLMNYLSFGYISAPGTIFSSIKKLQAANVATHTMDGAATTRYWRPSFADPRDRGDAEMLEELTELLDDAVRIRLISDVPLGAFLSGGIDSSLVVASMARCSLSKVKTHTIGTNDASYNEARIARRTAAYLGTDHREFTVTPDARSCLERVAWHMDEPFGDPSVLPTWYVCEMTRRSVTVALSGDGGDESFGGYTFRYIPHRLEAGLKDYLPAPLRASLFGPLGKIWPRSSSVPKWLRLKSIFHNLAIGNDEAFYSDLLQLNETDLASVMSSEFSTSLAGYDAFESVGPIYRESDAPDALGRAQYADLNYYMTEDVLVKVDRMSMAHSLEVRAPLLDYRLIEFAAGLPSKAKVSWRSGKLPLRMLAPHRLPASLLSEPKRGFTVPVHAWLRGDLRELAEAHLFDSSSLIADVLDVVELRRLWDAHQQGQQDNSAFLWSILMLGVWESQYAGELTAPVLS